MQEYRIKYKLINSVLFNYHYYMATDPVQALMFHNIVSRRKNSNIETISIESYCRYANKWNDESDVLKKEFYSKKYINNLL